MKNSKSFFKRVPSTCRWYYFVKLWYAVGEKVKVPTNPMRQLTPLSPTQGQGQRSININVFTVILTTHFSNTRFPDDHFGLCPWIFFIIILFCHVHSWPAWEFDTPAAFNFFMKWNERQCNDACSIYKDVSHEDKKLEELWIFLMIFRATCINVGVFFLSTLFPSPPPPSNKWIKMCAKMYRVW